MKSMQVALLVLLALAALSAGVENTVHQRQGTHRRLRHERSVAHSSEISENSRINMQTHGDHEQANDKQAENKDDGDDDDGDEEDDEGEESGEDDAAKSAPKESAVDPKKAAAKSRKDRAAEDQEMDRREQAELAVAKAHDKLDENQHKQAAISADLKDLRDERAQRAEVETSVKLVASETQSKSLAHFLGDMWKEMRMFATPFYEEHQEEDLADLQQQEVVLKQRLEEARATRDAFRKGGEKEEVKKEEPEPAKDDVKMEKEQAVAKDVKEEIKEEKEPESDAKKAKTEAAPEPSGTKTGDYQAMFTPETMPAVSPTLKCVMNLMWQYFLVYTALAVVKTIKDQSKRVSPGVEKAEKFMEACTATVTYAPMLCVLFLATRMRAIQLSQGQTERYALPQPWVQSSMLLCTLAVFLQVILVIIISIITGPPERSAEGATQPPTAKALAIVHCIVMAALYVGAGAVCIGALLMKGPAELWENGAPSVSPALQCTMILTTVFFIVYLGFSITSLVGQFRNTDLLRKLNTVFKHARYCVNLAPMLCILFVAARMRALQIDPKYGKPQSWAQRCFYTCTIGVVVQVLLAIIIPLADKGAKEKQMRSGVVYMPSNLAVQTVVDVLRYIALFCTYSGACAVMASVFLIQSPQGFEVTPPVSPAMQCVIGLTCQYFLVATALFICYSILEYLGDHKKNTIANVQKLLEMFEDGMKSVMFAPMLSMLFVGARMRALQLTRTVDDKVPPTAGPQYWAQEGMYLATWSVFVQLVMAILNRLIVHATRRDPEGSNKMLSMVLDIIKYICLLSMYGGALVVMVAIYKMTPANLQPYAHQGLVPGVEVPQPPTMPPAHALN